MTILVFGSNNLDLVVRTPTFPTPGETLTGQDFASIPGGKGANQAVAAAQLGATAQMVGRVGGDSFGQTLIEALQAVGVNTTAVEVDEAIHSGVAAIAVDDQGENQIIVVPGANGRIDARDVARLMPLLGPNKILLLQLEIPLEAVHQAATAARAANSRVILDPAPVPSAFPDDLHPLIDILTPNQIEAQQLTGVTVSDPATAAQAAQILRSRGTDTVIVKLGDQGVLCATPHETQHCPALPVQAVDTTAAGDAFNGGLAAALAEGQTLPQAVVWGNAVAALSVTQPGAQPAMPSRDAVEALVAAPNSVFGC